MAKVVNFRVGGICWQVAAEYRDQLFDAEGLRLDEWLRAGRAQVVKNGPHRTVYRIVLPGLSCYLKHYRVADARAWLRGLVRPSQARVEHWHALAAAQRLVPTVVPLAVGEGGAGLLPGESFLITRSLEDTEPLNQFLATTLSSLAPNRRSLIRQRLARELGRMIARMHDAGMVHRDLHAGNLLVRLEAEDVPRLFVIDLHAVAFGSALTWRASRANLVILNRWFVLCAARSDRLRFWRAYCAERGPAWFQASPGMRASARDLEHRSWKSNWRFWRNRDRRCLAVNRHYRRVRQANVAGHAVADLHPSVLYPFLADPDGPFRHPGAVLLKDSRSSTVAELDLRVGADVRRVIYKRFRVTSWSDPWKALLRRSSALRSWVNGHGLRDRGLPTPRPLAVFHRRRVGLVYEGYLLTDKIPSAVDLRRCLDELCTLPPGQSFDARRRLIDQVARLVRELHRRRLSHRDLKAANVLVSGGVLSGEWSQTTTYHSPLTTHHLWLIDLVGLTCHRHLRRSRRVQNLARLHASFWQGPLLTRTDRLRFLRTYLQFNLVGRWGWKRWWHEVAAATDAKIARNLRTGRLLA
jgi:tRNA A-37 threonylcarbamoyl transferase component Bud32